MKFDDEIALAWDLFDALPALPRTTRVSLCVEIGAAEMPGAIEHLLSEFVASGRGLPTELASRVSGWLDSYGASANASAIRGLLRASIFRSGPKS